MHTPRLRVYVADDHALVREGIKMLIASQADMEVIGEAGDGETAVREARALRPDVVVMDVSMPILNGAQATERLRACSPDVRILALSAYSDEEHIRQLLASGASGYVLKKAIAEELTGAIRAVARGGVHLDPSIAGAVVGGYVAPQRNGVEVALSPREHDVMLLVAWGHTNKEIAEKLHLSVKTVEGHKTRSMEKLGVQSRSDVVRYALKRGWLRED
jgi:two-component system response regulator NreC